MKTIKIFFIIILFFASLHVKAQSEDYDKAKNQITKILSEVVLDEKLNGVVTFEIVLSINEQNKIIVSDVTSYSNTLKRNVRLTLNNKKLNKDMLKVDKNYTFSITFKFET